MWLILTAAVLLLSGLLIWSSAADIDSFATGTAKVENGSMYIRFDNDQIAQNIETGMTVSAGKTESSVSSIGTDADGDLFAVAPTTLADGNYPVRILFRRTKVLSLLFN